MKKPLVDAVITNLNQFWRRDRADRRWARAPEFEVALDLQER